MKRTLLALAAVLALLAGACSDGSGSDDSSGDGGGGGGDSETITIWAVGSLEGQLDRLAEAYKKDSPNTTVKIEYGSADELTQKITGDGEKPDLFVARKTQVSEVNNAGKATGSAVLVGSDLIQLVVPLGNPFGVTGLDAFEAGSDAQPGLCNTDARCGVNGDEVLQNAGVTPGPQVQRLPGGELLDKVVAGEIGASLMFRTQAAQRLQKVATVPLPPEVSPEVDYVIVATSNAEGAAKFVDWVKSSKTAQDRLAADGLRPLVVEGAGQ